VNGHFWYAQAVRKIPRGNDTVRTFSQRDFPAVKDPCFETPTQSDSPRLVLRREREELNRNVTGRFAKQVRQTGTLR